MFLERIYSEPEGLFKTVEFKDGVNFIFGQKDNESDSKDSLNGIGKSLLIDLIDFCLLGSIASNHNPRLHKAKKMMGDHLIVLEFEMDGKHYMVRRDPQKPNKDIEFGLVDDLKKYTESELKPLLCDLMFLNEDYDGKYYNKWFRKLLPFYIKKERPKKGGEFTDPVKYLENTKPMELNIYHLFLMGIDNTLAYKNFDIQSNLKEKGPVMEGIERFVRESYGLENISTAHSEIDRIKREAKHLEGNIESFKLASEYENAEGEANELTAQIKELWHQNYSHRKNIDTYQKSYQADVGINVGQIEKIYKEASELLAGQIKKTLDEAVEFRKHLSESRKNFLSGEIDVLKTSVKTNEQKIGELEEKRAKVFGFLSAKKAITDLSEAYLSLSRKRDELNELEGKVKLYLDFSKERADLKSEEAKLVSEMLTFVRTIQETKLPSFRDVFTEVYNSAYIENRNESTFDINVNERTDAKINIDVAFPADLSKGKNRGRTLVYDLAVLLHSIKEGLRAPRFLIHDGVFDGMYKGHFVHLYEYLEQLKTRNRFQYIVTLNEEGELNERFGNTDNLSVERIAREAIITITPSKKLFGKTWS
jgi:uncharacterized protein YydD (DUF2326 family)